MHTRTHTHTGTKYGIRVFLNKTSRTIPKDGSESESGEERERGWPALEPDSFRARRAALTLPSNIKHQNKLRRSGFFIKRCPLQNCFCIVFPSFNKSTNKSSCHNFKWRPRAVACSLDLEIHWGFCRTSNGNTSHIIKWVNTYLSFSSKRNDY